MGCSIPCFCLLSTTTQTSSYQVTFAIASNWCVLNMLLLRDQDGGEFCRYQSTAAKLTKV